MKKDDWNPLRQDYMRGLLLPLAIVAILVVGASVAGAHILSDEPDTGLRNTLFGGGFGLVVTFIIFMLALWISQVLAHRSAEPTVAESPKAPVPFEALPPYQPIRPEPTITIQIPARTLIIVVLSLAALAMIYFRVLRQDRSE